MSINSVGMSVASLKPKTDEDLQRMISVAVTDAVEFINRDIAPVRIKAQEYFDGKVDIGEEEGRSKVVATKVRDTIRAVKPSLMRIFLAHERPVEFIASNPGDAAWVDQATTYARIKFTQNHGFKLLNTVFDDALRKKQGILKAWYEKDVKAHIYSFTELTDAELQMVLAEEGVELIEHSATTEQAVPGEEGPAAPAGPGNPLAPQMAPQMPAAVTLHDIKVIRTKEDGDIKIVAVPPEEFFISRNARDIETAYVHGHRTDMPAGDVAAMYDLDVEEISELGSFTNGGSNLDQEEQKRRQYKNGIVKDDEKVADPTMQLVSVTEAYMRVDRDGTGHPVLHRFILGGTEYKILHIEPADESPFSVFEIDPEAHAFHGRSIYDLIKNEQDAATATIRGILDNVAMTNNPRIGAVEGQVNLDDLMNNEIGGIIRMRQPGAIQDISVPFVAGQTLPALQYLDDLVEQKTGVTRASQGLDPDALQSTTKAAVTATIQASAAQIEVMARNLAEGGMSQLFKLILRLSIKHARSPEDMPMGQSFVQVDPRVWNADARVHCNVGLGTGREEEKQMALGMTLQTQMGILQAYGLQNGLVTLTNLRNTLADILAGAGLRNADRYYAPMNPQIEQQMQQQAAQAAQQNPHQQPIDPSQALMQTEQMKAMNVQQIATGKLQLEADKAKMQDDLKRDKMAQDLFLKGAQIASTTGLQIHANQLKAEQAAPRAPGGAPAAQPSFGGGQ